MSLSQIFFHLLSEICNFYNFLSCLDAHKDHLYLLTGHIFSAGPGTPFNSLIEIKPNHLSFNLYSCLCDLGEFLNLVFY